MFNIKIRDGNKIVVHKDGVVQGNILSPLFLNIYLTPLDRFAENCIKEFHVGDKRKRNYNYYKLISLTNEEKEKLSPMEASLRIERLKRLHREVPKFIYDSSFLRVKYVRYADDFIVGVLGKKKLAVKIKSLFSDFIFNNFHLEANKEKTKLTNVFNDSANFLSCKIHNTKRKYLSFSKPKAIEKKVRVARRIKIRQNIYLNRVLKNSADNLWNRFKSNPNDFLSSIHHLKDHDFSSSKAEIINALKLNRRHGIRELAKIIPSQLSLFVEAVDKSTENLFSNIRNILETLENHNDTYRDNLTKITKTTMPLSKKFIVELISESYGTNLCISQQKASYLVTILNKRFPHLIWPVQVPRKVPLPPNFQLENVNEKNKIIYLADFIKFLESNQYKFDADLMIKKIPKFKSHSAIFIEDNKTVQ